jgi:2-keto-4-pentenoate hydratase/2-oxohepta-3-ene-1,7-dioic acid hydratase in catechol pathway
MRYLTFEVASGSPRLGALLADGAILDLAAAAPAESAFASMLDLIAAGSAGTDAAAGLASRSAAPGELDRGAVIADPASVRILAPIPAPRRNVFCVGLNYPSHVEQNARALGIAPEIPSVPLFFSKPTTAVIGPEAGIRLDRRLTSKLDYEVELAIIIGPGGTWIPERDALDHVFGFTLLNDVSARDLQWRTSQMFIGKGLDSYCPVGPWIADRADVGDGDDLELTCRVNGELRQHDTTANMVFGVRQIVAELSKGLTLQPGDIIATGTPGGCGYQMLPPQFLEPGDVVELAAPGLGALTNPVVAWGPADEGPAAERPQPTEQAQPATASTAREARACR